MGILIDIILLGILALSIFLGYRKGLIKVIVKLFAFLIALVVTLVLYKHISNLIIEKTDLDEKIEAVIIENGTKELEENEGEIKEDGFIANIQDYIDTAVTGAQNEIIESLAEAASIKVINLISIIGIFVITRILLIVLVLISDLITKLPIIKQFNKLGGTVYGILRGLLLIHFILAIVFLIVSIAGGGKILPLIDTSIITKFMYTNNILINIIF